MRRALLVGLDDYAQAEPLQSCGADIRALERLLSRNADGTPNFRCEALTSADPDLITRARLRMKLHEHFKDFDGDVLFYFSGHGTATSLGGHLVTYDSSPYDLGLPMGELVRTANRSKAKNVFIFLDCCDAGRAGDDEEVVGTLENEANIREGITLLAAARPRQTAREAGGHGVFTRLVLAALDGGAADVRGQVSAAAIYAYAEAVLGSLDQRPLYKSHAASLAPVRLCDPAVEDRDLRRLPELFTASDATVRLATSYEHSHPAAIPEHVAIFQRLKSLQVARLLSCESGKDMYWTALRAETVSLTPLGRFYWELAKAERI